ncbi:hypothetical protein [Pelagibacterium halotolerans]|uniref:Uncharacterized protein n=1 Tax=Pelagibacterium halotolerans (strain DSM 22347 / JCM 15775 / CGMCC 1.7692 / B2) TaxID=1082931 RepID=G4RC76_PELHB|nr:hypothetical protein [Pelagibacterium halotolerans]AEQ52699.1 hypothetical protein KKY_2691 [Pelagibacterium halotolerans B2]QJR17599.1 hypothetical protein HKM20_03580 [Pelagibacterium halotolerans]SEA84642.1 hypothetical protein SAMN05428936_10993 [Pelagibacterium halotolerans]
MLDAVEAPAGPVTLRSHLGDGADTLMWVQEELFGHRFVEEQLPYMLVLEVLAICRVLQLGDDGRHYSETRIFNQKGHTPQTHESIIIPVIRSVELRYILFRDNSLDRIAKDERIAAQDRFDAWVEALNRGFANEVRIGGVNFAYLKDRFDGNFEDARQAVRIIKGLELDVLNNRRYTSKFLAPRGPSLILNDVDLKYVADRAFFGRGGEMIYLMLNRSARASDVAREVKQYFLSTSDPAERLASRLVPNTNDRTQGGAIGYLPLDSHPAYDRLAEDWNAILTLRSLPPPQKFEPLFRMTALNLVCYFADRAREVSGNAVDPIPLDMTGGANSNLRDVSKNYLNRHKQVIDDAVESHIREKIAGVHAWNVALAHEDAPTRSEMAVDAIVRTFDAKRWADKAAASEGIKKPEVWLEAFISATKRRDRNNISSMITPLGKSSGFVVARRSAGTWFSASDEFLEALVLATVRGPITIDDFLTQLYKRYGIVIGPAEQREAFDEPPCDVSAFEENLRVLEKRLTGLGYVKRLSDDCAFVSNVYSRDEQS